MARSRIDWTHQHLLKYYSWRADGTPEAYKTANLLQAPEVLFDREQRLLSGIGPAEHRYRADGLRAAKVLPDQVTWYLYDGANLVCEMYGGGAVKTAQTWGPDGLVSRGGEFYQYNLLGDVAMQLDAQGQVVDRPLYDAWGNRRNAGAGTVYGYRGQYGYYWDSDTELHLLTWRWYDPELARFVTRDPIGYNGGMNLYGYVDNDPIGFVDPSGLRQRPSRPCSSSWWDTSWGAWVAGFWEGLDPMNALAGANAALHGAAGGLIWYGNAAARKQIGNRNFAVSSTLGKVARTAITFAYKAAQAAAEAGAEGLDALCFDADTLVTRADGAKTRICELAVGDQVLAVDANTGALRAARVLAVKEHATDQALELRLADGESLITTPEHVFLLANGDQVAAADLTPGCLLRTADGEPLALAGAGTVSGPRLVYNLELEAPHTYVVGNSRVVVHNMKVARLMSAAEAKLTQAGGWQVSTKESLTPLGATNVFNWRDHGKMVPFVQQISDIPGDYTHVAIGRADQFASFHQWQAAAGSGWVTNAGDPSGRSATITAEGLNRYARSPRVIPIDQLGR